MLDLNFIRKDLYKSKVNAKFSHYCAGKLYYTVELSDGRVFQFPIKNVDQEPDSIIDLIMIEHGGDLSQDNKDILNIILRDKKYHSIELSSDLGQTPFNAEIKASELNRWIAKAFDKGDFICINKAPEMLLEPFKVYLF